MLRPGRLIKPLLVVLLIYAVYLIRGQVLFEKFLNSLYISWDDFPPDYVEALVASKENNAPVQYNYSLFPPTDPSTKIPRVIHFIWFKDLYQNHLDVTEMPTRGSRAPEICGQWNPDYTINIWNSTGARHFLETNYPNFMPTYDAYKYPIERIDALKYFVLWHYGGVYMDLDISCRRPLDPLLQYSAWFPRASPLGVNNDLMASRPRHPLVGMMTEKLKPRNKDLFFPYLTVYWATGPQFTSDVLKMWYNQLAGTNLVVGESEKDSDPDAFYVLPQIFYSEEYTFFGHSPGGSWHGPDVAVVLWLVERPWVVILVGLTLMPACLALVLRRRNPTKAVLV